MEYSDQTVKLIDMVIYDTRKGTVEKGASFSQRYFLHKRLKKFGREGRDAPTKEMDQIYVQTCFDTISIKDLTPQEKKTG